eukprot:COSAG02_NODE_2172_length_9595_cov_9.363521_2_plen_62_part_00
MCTHTERNDRCCVATLCGTKRILDTQIEQTKFIVYNHTHLTYIAIQIASFMRAAHRPHTLV